MYMYMQHITYHSYIVVLKARHLGGSVFCRLGMPEQALGGIPLGFGIAVEDKLSELHVHRHCTCNTLVHCSHVVSSISAYGNHWL